MSRPSSAPPEAEDDSLDALATRILARARGVVGPAPSDVGGAIARALARLIAMPLGLVLGAGLGLIMALLAALAGGNWKAKIFRVLAAPSFGIFAGVSMGWRLLARGSIDALPVIAGLLHRFAPVVAFPDAVRHHVFGLVLVTRYDDVRMVLERDDVFRVDGYDERMRAAGAALLLGMDRGPAYEREQRLAGAALGHEIEPLRELVASLSRTLIDKACDRSRTLDVVTELAHPVQLAVLDRCYGVPNTRDERLIPWLETASYFIFNFWIGGPYRVAASEAGRDLTAHLRRVVRRRSEELANGAPSRADVLGRLLDAIRVTCGDPKLPTHEDLAVRIMTALVLGATVPTAGLFISAVDHLLSLSADERAALKKAAHLKDDATVKRFAFEAARFCAYPPSLYRHAAMPYVFHAGTKHEAIAERGAWVVTLPVLANYDARVFRNPDTFNPMREPAAGAGPLLFGWAEHRCLGEHMAELLMVEMAKPLFAKGIARTPGPDGKLKKGESGVIPDGDFARRLVVRFD